MLLSELLTFSPLTLVLLGLCAGLALLLVGQRRRYRTRMTSPTNLEGAAIVRVDHAGWHPDRRTEADEKLATLTEEHARLKASHTVLLARHKAIIREFQRMQQEPPTRTRPVAPRKVGAQA